MQGHERRGRDGRIARDQVRDAGAEPERFGVGDGQRQLAIRVGREVVRVRAEQGVKAHRFDLFRKLCRLAGRGLHDDAEFGFAQAGVLLFIELSDAILLVSRDWLVFRGLAPFQ